MDGMSSNKPLAYILAIVFSEMLLRYLPGQSCSRYPWVAMRLGFAPISDVKAW